MFGFTTKERITKLILSVSFEMANAYKDTLLSTDNLQAALEGREINKGLKEYQDAVAYECCNRIEKTNAYAGAIMRKALDDPTIVGFDSNDFAYGKGAGFVYCTAYYALEHIINKDMAYCVKLNHAQLGSVSNVVQKENMLNEVIKNDKYNHFKKNRPIDLETVYSGIMKCCDMFFLKKNIFPNGENDIDKSRIVGLCAYEIAAWTTSANPKLASEVCYMYGNNFKLYNKPATYANEMLEIANNTYREIRNVTDSIEKTTRDVKEIVQVQAERFAQISSIAITEDNIASIEEIIYFFINQYLVPEEKLGKQNNDIKITSDQEREIFKKHEQDETLDSANSKTYIKVRTDIDGAENVENKSNDQLDNTGVEVKKCKYCGKRIPSGGIFCPACGRKSCENEASDTISDEDINQMRKLKQLYDEGILTEEEYTSKKKQLLKL